MSHAEKRLYKFEFSIFFYTIWKFGKQLIQAYNQPEFMLFIVKILYFSLFSLYFILFILKYLIKMFCFNCTILNFV